VIFTTIIRTKKDVYVKNKGQLFFKVYTEVNPKKFNQKNSLKKGVIY
jgi:hypothetical protein